MRLHTRLNYTEVHAALQSAKDKGRVTPDVHFETIDPHGSRTHDRSFDIQLGTWEKDTLPAGTTDQYGKNMRVRRYKNGGNAGATSEEYGPIGAVWAATYDEWGWFMAEVFAADPGARWAGGYASADDFDRKTDYKFTEV